MNRMKKGVFLALLVLSLLAGCGTASPSATAEPSALSGSLTAYFFPAGKADAILLYTDAHAVLIDTGEAGFGDDILSYLEEKGIDHLDAMIITHFDQDHVGGAAAVLAGIRIDAVYASDRTKDSDEYKAYKKALAAAGLSPVTVAGLSQEVLTLDGMTIRIDGPDDDHYSEKDDNNSSLITTLTYGTTSWLFMGDAMDQRIREFLTSDSGAYDVLKVPYHGYYQDTLAALIKTVAPKAAVICCGKNSGGDADTVSLLRNAGADTYLTSDGGITMTTDGTAITISQ